MSANPEVVTVEYMLEKAKSGDIIAFSGNSPVSKLIKYITRSNISHVGIVVESQFKFFKRNSKQIVEATFSGVSVSSLKARIEKVIRNNQADAVWMLPLKEELDESKSKLLNNFLASQLGKKFDYFQSIKSAFDEYDPNPFTYAEENFNEFFCSELVAAALEKSGVVEDVNASEVTPADICMFNIFKDIYYQFHGASLTLNGYNTVSPYGWGE